MMTGRTAYTLFFALCALTAQATEHGVKLPEEWVGRWCAEAELETETQEFFSIAQDNLRACSGGHVYFWETGYSGSGGYCEFDKIEKTASAVYLVRANCKGQSGIEGFWTENFELQIIGGYLVLSVRPKTF